MATSHENGSAHPPSTAIPKALEPTKDTDVTIDTKGAPPAIYHKESLHANNGHPLTALQSHILFWDPDGDSIIWPTDVYNGFRALGFSIPFAILSLLIPLYFSYPTTLGHALLPDPRFRIYVRSIQKAKHGSDTGVYDLDGHFRTDRFEELWARFDRDRKGGLDVADLWALLAKDRVAMDFAGWSFAAMEWSTTWLLLQREGRVGKEDLRAVYDGSLFWRIKEANERGGWKKGFGWEDIWMIVVILWYDFVGVVTGWLHNYL